MKSYHLEGVFNIPHVGYGRMVICIKQALSRYVTFGETSEAVIFAIPTDMIKGWYGGQRTAVLTMWETTVVPDKYHRTITAIDTLLVPCDQNAELFAPYHKNIHVVPLGINHDDWYPSDRPANNKFRFVTGGSGWKRKGIGQIIQAFRELNLPDSELYIKCTPDLLDDPKAYDFGQDIHVVKQTLSVAEEREFYNQADCFVSASRGEGFGMIPLQNIALGNPVIAPLHTGHLMFGNLIDYPLGWHMETASMQYFTEIGEWWVPNLNEMKDAMRAAYNKGRPPLWERQMRFESTLQFSWDNTAKRIMQVFPPGDPIPNPGPFLDAGGRKIKVRALRTCQIDVGRYTIKLTAGERTEVPCSTLMHLFEVGAVTEI